MGDLLQIPTYGVCSLDAIGLAFADTDLLVAADARRREVYWARYRNGTRISEPSVAKPAAVLEEIDGATGMAGAGARLYADVLGLPLLDCDHPPLASLVAVAAERLRSGAPGETLTPLYLRRPDAVEPAAAKTGAQ